MYLEENLKLTPQNMSDKAVALDELKEMHQQVISHTIGQQCQIGMNTL